MQVIAQPGAVCRDCWCVLATVLTGFYDPSLRAAAEPRSKTVARVGTLRYTSLCFCWGDSMSNRHTIGPILALIVILSLQACGGGGLFSQKDPGSLTPQSADQGAQETRGSSFFDLFEASDDPNITLEVNKYLWNASLEVLNFLPIQSADPFSGVIVTGFGTPPRGRTSYRATILVQDPALDARSLNVAVLSRSGPVDEATRLAVENAILARARQLRIRDLNL